MSLRVPMADLLPGERTLDAEQAKYVARVHRLRAGDTFVAFDPTRALECDAEVLDEKRVRLGATRAARAATRAITWIHGCPKGDKADAIVRDATELGATRIIFVQTARSVSKPPAARATRWAKIARDAARQCGRGDAPDVALAKGWESALESAGDGTRVVLDPTGGPFARLGASGALVFAAGPEGGLTPEEVAAATARGFVACRLGAFVMRTETVPAAVLGAVALATAG
jgi:16S rRNA (uracil1498-N3)-methyltransferase